MQRAPTTPLTAASPSIPCDAGAGRAPFADGGLFQFPDTLQELQNIKILV